MAQAQGRPEKESFILVRFFSGAGAGTQNRYTDWTQDFLGHASTPGMEVDISENVGTFDDRETRVILPIDTFSERISNGLPHSPIFVEIEEVTQGLFIGDQNSQRQVFTGRVVKTIRNFQGESDRVGIFCLPVKSRLDIKLGIPCNHHCPWTLFDQETCQLSKASFQVSGVIDSVDGQEITVTDTGVTSQVGTYWRRGYIEFDDLRIAIRDWSDADPTKLYMARRIPNDWITGSPTVVFVPGCDKNIETCRTRYNNEQHFGGIGFAIPAYNPLIESP